MDRPLSVAQGLASFAARTPTLPPATHTNSYALGEREVLLIEPATPHPDEQRAWLDWARGLQSQGRSLVALFATHHHNDHVGGASFFAGALGLPLWAHRATAERISTPVARLLDEGDLVDLDGPHPQRWRALHTPGHAPGHLCLHEPSLGALIVGDMVASEGTILVAPGEGDMAEYLRQLARIDALGARVALPAHGAPIDDPSAVFRRYITHRLGREAKIASALRAAGPSTLDRLVPLAYDDVPASLHGIAALSLEAHLIKLIGDGRVSLDGGLYTSIEGAS